MLVRKGSKICKKESNENDRHLQLDLEDFANDVLDKVKRNFNNEIIVDDIRKYQSDNYNSISYKLRFPNWRPNAYITFILEQLGEYKWHSSYIEKIKVKAFNSSSSSYNEDTYYLNQIEDDRDRIISLCAGRCIGEINQSSKDYPRKYGLPKKKDDATSRSPIQKSLI